MRFTELYFIQKGFTLVELVLVLVIIGLLSAVAIPRFIESNNEKEYSEKRQVSGAVKAAWIIAKADTRLQPSVNSLVSYVRGEHVQATDKGVYIQHDGVAFMIPTYVDANCSNPTRNPNDLVACVGAIDK